MAYDGIVVGAPTFDTPGKFGGCASGFTANDYLFVSPLIQFPIGCGTPTTLEFFWKTTVQSSDQIALGADGVGSISADSNGYFLGQGGMLDGNWHHFALVVDGQGSSDANGKLYFDGIHADIGGWPALNGCLVEVGNGLEIFSLRPWFGSIDDLAFWTTEKYTGNFTPRTSPLSGYEGGLLAYYPFDGDALNHAIATATPVTGQPVIALNPVSASVVSGAQFSLASYAAGTPAPTVQWEADGGTGAWANIAGATGSTPTFTASISQQYRAVFVNTAGTAISAAAAITVTQAAALTVPFASEFAPDITWTAIQALLAAQLGDGVDVDCIGEHDFDEQGDLTVNPPAARVLFLDEVSRGSLDPQNCSYNADQAFAVICAAENLRGVQSQRIATLQLAAQVKHILVGARLALPDGSAGGDRTEPVLYAGMSPLPTSDLGMAYVAKFVIPNIAQFAAPNAYPHGGN